MPLRFRESSPSRGGGSPMRALTNGEGEEEEAAASAGAGPGLGRKRRRAEQRGAQRARAAEARGAGRAKGVLRHDPWAQPGRATLRSSAQVAGHGAGVAQRSPSPTVRRFLSWTRRWEVQRGRMTPRHDLTFLLIGPTSPAQRHTRRCQEARSRTTRTVSVCQPRPCTSRRLAFT